MNLPNGQPPETTKKESQGFMRKRLSSILSRKPKRNPQKQVLSLNRSAFESTESDSYRSWCQREHDLIAPSGQPSVTGRIPRAVVAAQTADGAGKASSSKVEELKKCEEDADAKLDLIPKLGQPGPSTWYEKFSAQLEQEDDAEANDARDAQNVFANSNSEELLLPNFDAATKVAEAVQTAEAPSAPVKAFQIKQLARRFPFGSEYNKWRKQSKLERENDAVDTQKRLSIWDWKLRPSRKSDLEPVSPTSHEEAVLDDNTSVRDWYFPRAPTSSPPISPNDRARHVSFGEAGDEDPHPNAAPKKDSGNFVPASGGCVEAASIEKKVCSGGNVDVFRASGLNKSAFVQK